MRKILVAVLAASLVSPIFTASTFAKDAKPLAAGEKKAGKVVRGTVEKVDGDKVTIKTAGKESKEVVVATDANTKVKNADGTDGKLADLKEGTNISVSPAEGTAQTITIGAPKKAK